MGLFDFASNLGRKLFNKDEEAAEKIRAHIEANNPGIANLEVRYNGGFVTLCGDCDDPEAVEKAILMAGNVQGVTKVVTEIYFPAEPGNADSGTTEYVEPGDVEYYEIQSGDTLSGIAKRYYGDASKYPQIFDANREVIQDPDLIFVGQKIRIPVQQ